MIEDAYKVVTSPTAEKPVEGKTVSNPAVEQPDPVGKATIFMQTGGRTREQPKNVMARITSG